MNLPALAKSRMGYCRILHWSIICLASAAVPLSAAPETPAAAAPGASLEELSDRFQNIGASVAKKAKDMMAIVQAEADSKRISNRIAEGLRWTLERWNKVA